MGVFFYFVIKQKNRCILLTSLRKYLKNKLK